MTWPSATGAGTVTARISAIKSKNLPLGMSVLVLTDAMAISPPLTRTEEVTVLVGSVTSFLP